MDKSGALLLIVLFAQMVTFIGVWGVMREVRLLGQTLERIRRRMG